MLYTPTLTETRFIIFQESRRKDFVNNKTARYITSFQMCFLKIITYDSIENMFEVVIDVTTLFINEIYINKENLTEKEKLEWISDFLSVDTTHMHNSM